MKDFQINDEVCLKKADPTEPQKKMIIMATNEEEQKVCCQYIKISGSVQDALSGRPQMVEPIKRWFPLSELEHVSETA